jgi:hypothetical protein
MRDFFSPAKAEAGKGPDWERWFGAPRRRRLGPRPEAFYGALLSAASRNGAISHEAP